MEVEELMVASNQVRILFAWLRQTTTLRLLLGFCENSHFTFLCFIVCVKSKLEGGKSLKKTVFLPALDRVRRAAARRFQGCKMWVAASVCRFRV